ncbi:MAG TPA: STELLO glycosyltransferase family protein [Verrucomicrobiae bacterium]|nr:STELLO glycosyltransferase family protein [Verrucomicrobiae bacterium]
MKQSSLYSVVTTIQPPTAAMRQLGRALDSCGGQLLIVADKKGPHTYALSKAELLTLEQQIALPLRLPKLLPVNHYVRKNVGYLIAISRKASCLYETDDDNAPNGKWKPRSATVRAATVRQAGWRNVYAYFSRSVLWPRGFPLEEIMSSRESRFPKQSTPAAVFSPIQQGLADGNPDVDAIWRLVQSTDIRFASKPSLALARGVWCPFNSQTTWWWPEAYPLLYLPSYCTFRMTDIWRSFIAQRCVWELGGVVTFHSPEVVQERNQHNLLRDFQDEVPGYLSNARICNILGQLKLKPGKASVSENLMCCYESLVAENIFPRNELRLVKAWLADLKSMARSI